MVSDHCACTRCGVFTLGAFSACFLLPGIALLIASTAPSERSERIDRYIRAISEWEDGLSEHADALAGTRLVGAGVSEVAADILELAANPSESKKAHGRIPTYAASYQRISLTDAGLPDLYLSEDGGERPGEEESAVVLEFVTAAQPNVTQRAVAHPIRWSDFSCEGDRDEDEVKECLSRCRGLVEGRRCRETYAAQSFCVRLDEDGFLDDTDQPDVGCDALVRHRSVDPIKDSYDPAGSFEALEPGETRSFTEAFVYVRSVHDPYCRMAQITKGTMSFGTASNLLEIFGIVLCGISGVFLCLFAICYSRRKAHQKSRVGASYSRVPQYQSMKGYELPQMTHA